MRIPENAPFYPRAVTISGAAPVSGDQVPAAFEIALDFKGHIHARATTEFLATLGHTETFEHEGAAGMADGDARVLLSPRLRGAGEIGAAQGEDWLLVTRSERSNALQRAPQGVVD